MTGAVCVGDEVTPFTVERVDSEKMKTVAALLRDPNPIHWDIEVVGRLGMGSRPINQGPTNMAYVINGLQAWAGRAAEIRHVSVRFQGNVFGGDRLIAGGLVTRVTRDEAIDLLTCDVWLDRDDGDRVLQGTVEVALPSDTPTTEK